MAQASTEFEFEDEWELEDETEHELEDEAFLGGLAKIAGSLLGEEEHEAEWEAEHELESEFEDEYEGEFESEFEDELEAEFEGEYEAEDEYEDEWETEFEDEQEYEDEAELEAEAEYFFKKIGRAFKRGLPVFKKLAKRFGPMLATAVGGPAAGMLAKAATSLLEGEFEDELEAELEEMATAPVSAGQAEAEYLAAQAAATESESEAESFVGSAVAMTLSPRDRRELEALLPALLRGASTLTRVLHRHPASRPGVRMVPSIVGSSARTIATLRSQGHRIRPEDVGAVMAGSAQRVLGDPRWQQAVARRHARGLAQVRRRRLRGRPARGYRSGYARPGVRRGVRRGAPVRTLRRRPSHVHAVRPGARVQRPRPGVVRVVTPVRVPGRNGAPPRTIRVVSDVKVPRGAVPTGRPVGLTARRRR